MRIGLCLVMLTFPLALLAQVLGRFRLGRWRVATGAAASLAGATVLITHALHTGGSLEPSPSLPRRRCLAVSLCLEIAGVVACGWSVILASRGCEDVRVTEERPADPDLQPEDERTALVQRLDHYRTIASAALVDVPWDAASRRLLPSTDMTIAGIVRHLAWVEDRWFQGRLVGATMPAPWDRPGGDDPDRSMRLAPGDTVDSIIDLYESACERSRGVIAASTTLSQVAAVPSFGVAQVNLRWILVHMIDETARHAGHLDLLRDALLGRRSSAPTSDA